MLRVSWRNFIVIIRMGDMVIMGMQGMQGMVGVVGIRVVGVVGREGGEMEGLCVVLL